MPSSPPPTSSPDASSSSSSSSATAASKAAPTVLLVNDNSKWTNLVRRAVWSVAMVGGFVVVILAGHLHLMVGVLLIQAAAFREIVRIAHEPSKDKKLPHYQSLGWYFFVITNYFLYGETLLHHFEIAFYLDSFGQLLAQNHVFGCYTLYILGIVSFVLSLKKGHYKYQFAQLAWTHMAILFVVVQPHFILNNILEGIVWFLLPVALVVCNDIMAYACGFTMGRTPLTELSPKKTWEGFIGGFIFTVLFSAAISRLLMQYDYLTCPAATLSLRPFATLGHTCQTAPAFIPIPFKLPPAAYSIASRLGYTSHTVMMAPFQLHAMAMAVFASIVAPFGGFFASGFKRAFNIKDFGDVIPGHGGITDRFDCQFLMGFFAYLYYTTFIAVPAGTSVTALLQSIATLPADKQLEIYEGLRAYLRANEILL